MSEGLTTQQAERFAAEYGQNIIAVEKKHNKLNLFFSQFRSPIILILLASSIITFLLSIHNKDSSEMVDTIMIFVIVLLSAVFGFFQDNKAENTIEALKLNSNPSIDVFRDGIWKSISAVSLVPGDYIRLNLGDIVPADCKVVRDNSVFLMEAVLTGEAKEISKSEGDTVFAGTTVSQGSMEGVVAQTGMRTEMGKIANELDKIEDAKGPFDEEISGLTNKITKGILVVLLVVFVINYKNFGVEKAFLVAVSLAVAAIPEGLPALVTLTLGMGAFDMSKKNVLVRRMSAIESIGKISHIFVDKTGTLTKNEMNIVGVENIPEEVIKVGALLTEARKVNKDGQDIIEGSPIDRALYAGAMQRGFDVDSLKLEYNLLHIEPFNPETKYSKCSYEKNGEPLTIFKGAPETILDLCSYNSDRSRMDQEQKELIQELINENSEKGYYLIGLAEGEEEIKWLSLLIFEDPLKDGISEAIAECNDAGIRVSMLTGDIHTTALNVAREIGLNTNGYINGGDLERLDDNTLREKIKTGVNVFSRVLPLHKLKVLRLFQKDEVVAMTGDGVNDALALKQAGIGVAMGKYGSEAAKQASDIVLLDDNFVSIVEAIKEGRRIRENIKKFINYLFVSNMAEIFVLLLIPLFYATKDLILLPVQILWINLLTDGIPALALGTDPANPSIMKRPPVGKEDPLIDKQLGITILIIGLKKTLLLMAIFFINLHFFGFLVARTALFTSFVFYEFVRIIVIRRQEALTFFSNKLLLVSLCVSILLQLVLIYTPLSGIFGAVRLGLVPMLIILMGTILGYFSAIILTDLIVKRLART